jgi:hypothetical protein
MCSVTVKKQHCNSLKFAILIKEIKEKVKYCFKDCSFYAIWGQNSKGRGGGGYYFLEGLNLNYHILC